MKQTAVEWLQEQLNPDMGTMQGVIIQELLEQAKQMEKEQIIDAFKHGELPPFFVNLNAEEYYKETYGDESTDAN